MGGQRESPMDDIDRLVAFMKEREAEFRTGPLAFCTRCGTKIAPYRLPGVGHLPVPHEGCSPECGVDDPSDECGVRFLGFPGGVSPWMCESGRVAECGHLVPAWARFRFERRSTCAGMTPLVRCGTEGGRTQHECHS